MGNSVDFHPRIVIIDSGIDLEHPSFKNKDIKGKSFLRGHEMDISDNIGHGTAIAGIILQHNPFCSLYVIKLFNSESNYIDIESLIHALEYIYANIECDIINLSLGISILENEDILTDILCAY